MNETTTPLEIPEAAFRAMMETGDEPMRDYVRAIAAPVVAAELRRLADTAPPADAYGLDHEDIAHDDGVREMAARLRARADQLDSAGG